MNLYSIPLNRDCQDSKSMAMQILLSGLLPLNYKDPSNTSKNHLMSTGTHHQQSGKYASLALCMGGQRMPIMSLKLTCMYSISNPLSFPRERSIIRHDLPSWKLKCNFFVRSRWSSAFILRACMVLLFLKRCPACSMNIGT